MTITLTENEAMFKHIRRIPVGQLKAKPDEELQSIRETLVKEVREVGRALQWIDGIIKLKTLEAKGGNSHRSDQQ
jgi:hypothetical protein